MRATRFEFEQRFWIIGAIFWVGFSLYAIDTTNCANWLFHLFAPTVDPASARANTIQHWIFGAGALLVFLAALIRTWATAYLRTEIVHDMSQHSESLIADGPYRWVRNPLYLANLPMTAGVGLMASRLGWFFMIVAMYVFVYRLILREEDGLLQNQGGSYAAYLKTVPRLFPSPVPRLPATGNQPHWGQAIAAEMFIWLFGVAVLCFAITLNFKLTGIIFAASFAIYFIAVRLVKKPAAVSS